MIEKANTEIENIKKMEELRKKEEEQKQKKELEKALSSVSKKYDELEGIYWYHDKVVKNMTGSSTYLYIGQKSSGSPWLRFVIDHSYSSDNSWLFINSYTINIDGEKFEINPSRDDISRYNSTYTMWEILDVTIDDNIKTIINKIISSKKQLCVAMEKILFLIGYFRRQRKTDSRIY